MGGGGGGGVDGVITGHPVRFKQRVMCSHELVYSLDRLTEGREALWSALKVSRLSCRKHLCSLYRALYTEY